MARAPTQWAGFLAQCLKRRVRADQFQKLSTALRTNSQARGDHICLALFQHLRSVNAAVDPLIPLYTEQLLESDLVNTNDVLFALLHLFSPRESTEANDDSNSNSNGSQHHPSVPFQALETIFSLVSRLYSTDDRPRTGVEVEHAVKTLAKWMNVMVQRHHAEAMMQDVSTDFPQTRPETAYTLNALGALASTVFESQKAIAVIKVALSHDSDLSKALMAALSSFIPLLGGNAIHISDRLTTFQKSHAAAREQNATSFEANGEESLNIGQLQINNIPEGPLIRSRANLFIYLDALLAGRPMFNDRMVLDYLQARYKGDNQSLIADLVVAAFDLISISVHRGDSQDRFFLPKCLLVNKLPPFIASIAASTLTYVPINFEFLLTQSLGRLDPSIFPSFSQGFGMGINSGALADVRQDFVFSCALHGLIQAESIERILGEAPMQTLPQGGRFVKEALVAQCSENPQGIEQLVNGLDSMDGNVGAIAEALAIVMSNYCSSSDTKSLRLLCNHLSGRPLALDAMLLFTDSTVLLSPLCFLIDEWKIEDEQSGHQSTYDDFGACFLLLAAFIDRYNLTLSELGDRNGTGFIAWLVKRRAASQSIDTITEEQQKHLSGWIRALFETEGIDDEITSSCSPQDFYEITPVIFSQTVLACQQGLLSMENLKSGLDLLLESFLLPCLIVAFEWLVARLWERHDDTEIVVQVLQKLIRPSSVHGNAFSMHGTILSISCRHLRRALTDVQQSGQRRVDTTKLDIDPLLAKLKPDMDMKRSADSSAEELAQWAGGQIQASTLFGLPNNFAHLASWSAPATMDMSLPSYSHRQFIVAVQIAGSNAVLHAIVAAINNQQAHGWGDLALDIGSALICSPMPGVPAYTAAPNACKVPLDVRNCLELEVQNAPKNILKDLQATETLVRLHRRVESQLAVLPMPEMNQISMNIPDVIQTIGLEEPGEISVGQPDSSLGFVHADDPLQLDITAALGGQDGDNETLDDLLPSAEENIFDGLQLDDDVDFG